VTHLFLLRLLLYEWFSVRLGKGWGKDGERMGKGWGKDGERMGKGWEMMGDDGEKEREKEQGER
jgi:hypothetical protein